MWLRILFPVLLICVLSHLSCSEPRTAVRDKPLVLAGTWEGETSYQTTFQGKEDIETTHYRIIFSDEGLFQLEQMHVNDPEPSKKWTHNYAFAGDNRIKISGINSGMDKEFTIYKTGENEMRIDVSGPDAMNESVPGFTMVPLYRRVK